MDVTKQYAIAWKGLKNGTYRFDFKVDNALFEAYGSTDIKDGDLSVGVTLERGESMLSLQTVIRGTVTVACDRCLEDCRLPVAFDGTLLVRFSDEVADYDGEVMWISPAEGEVSLAQYIYESIVLSLPYQRVHPEGECDPDMLGRFRIVSDEEFEQGRTDLQKAEEELQNAKENLEIVKNGITSRYKELSNTQIRSTIDGMILDVPIKVGNSVIQANTFNDGTTIATVADMSNMQFQGNVDETDVGKLHEGMPVQLTIGALQNVELDANLEYVSPKATEDNGVIMFEVKAAVKIPADVFVRAGYSANASIVIESREGVLTLPESTVEFEGEKTYVYLLTSADGAEEQTFDKHEVKIGLSDGINIELTEGVTADDKVRGAKEDKKK